MCRAFRTILKGDNNAKLLFHFAFSDLESLIIHLIVGYFALCFYFAVTGIARLEVAMGDEPNFIFLSFFISFHCTCLLLLLLLLREEVRSGIFTGRAE